MDPQTQDELTSRMPVTKQQIEYDLARAETDRRVDDLERQREAARADARAKEAMNAAAHR